MTVTLNIPEDLSGELTAKFGNLGRAAMEWLAAKAYRDDCLSLEQVRRLLDLPSRWEAQAVLAKHDSWPGLAVEDVEHDLATLDKWSVES